jgi:magnesium transporter
VSQVTHRSESTGPLDELVRTALHPVRGLRVIGRFVRRASKRPGSAPGTVVHTGPRRVEATRVQIFRYSQDALTEESTGTLPETLDVPEAGSGVLWLNVEGLHDVKLLERIGAALELHPLAVEDVASIGQRPKLEEYDDHLFLVAHMLTLAGDAGHVVDEQVSLMVGRGFVVTFQEAPGDVFEAVRERLREGRGRIRSRGADYLAYTLLDAIVDHYFVVLEKLGEVVEELEEEVLERPTRRTMHRVHGLKRELLAVRRSIWPLREMLSGFLRVESALVDEGTRLYLRDVYDHCYQLIDSVEILREVGSGLRDLYLSNVSNRTNEVMKVLTIMASVFIPLTFVAGVYGMNFEYMPELEMRWAYPAVLGFMLVAALAMLWIFRSRGWIGTP